MNEPFHGDIAGLQEEAGTSGSGWFVFFLWDGVAGEWTEMLSPVPE